MIYVVLLIVLIGFGASAIAMVQKHRYIPVFFLTLLLICGLLWLIVQNDTQSLGMTNGESTTTKPNSSYNSPIPLLVYKQLGTTKKTNERVYSYRLNNDTKQRLTKTQHFSIKVVKGQNISQATLVKTVKHERFTSSFWHILFLGTQPDRTTFTTYTFRVPQNWLVLESSQARQFSKAAKQLRNRATTDAKSSVQKQVTALVTREVKAKAPADIKKAVQKRLTANPTLSDNPAKVLALQKNVTSSVTKSLTASVTAKIKKQQLPKIEQRAKKQAVSKITHQLQQSFDSAE